MADLNFDSNIWYQITNDRYEKTDASLRAGDSLTAIYMYKTNTTSLQEQWQIYPAIGGGGWNIRNAATGSGAYVTQCAKAVSTSECSFFSISTDISNLQPNETDICMALGNPGDIERRWILKSNGDGSFKIGLNTTNPAFEGYSLYVNSNNYVTFTTSKTISGRKWTFHSITEINDSSFSSGVPGATPTATATKTAQTPKNTSDSSDSSNSGLSTGAKAGIGAGVGILALALILLLGLWLIRRRRKQRLNQATIQPPQDYQNIQDFSHYQDSNPSRLEWKHELDAPQSSSGTDQDTNPSQLKWKHELDAPQNPSGVELPANKSQHGEIAELGADIPYQYSHHH